MYQQQYIVQCAYTLNSRMAERASGHCKVDCQMCDCSEGSPDPPGTIKIHWQSGDMVDGRMQCSVSMISEKHCALVQASKSMGGG